MTPTRRHHVCDELGVLRSFYTLIDAKRFAANNPDLTIRSDPRPTRPPVVDWSNFVPAPF